MHPFQKVDAKKVEKNNQDKNRIYKIRNKYNRKMKTPKLVLRND